MTKYNNPLEEAQDQSMFVSNLAFTEEGFVVDFTYKNEVTDSIMGSRSFLIFANSEDMQDLYLELQLKLQSLVVIAQNEMLQ